MPDTNSTVERIAPTPGPWTCDVVIDSSDINSGDIIQPTYAINRGGLAWPKVSRLEARANARLIAAAPDLLQALREVVGAHQVFGFDPPIKGDAPYCCFCCQEEGQPHDPDCTMHFVLDAIAKAEGRS